MRPWLNIGMISRIVLVVESQPRKQNLVFEFHKSGRGDSGFIFGTGTRAILSKIEAYYFHPKTGTGGFPEFTIRCLTCESPRVSSSSMARGESKKRSETAKQGGFWVEASHHLQDTPFHIIPLGTLRVGTEIVSKVVTFIEEENES
jgi:hypothetical protein